MVRITCLLNLFVGIYARNETFSALFFVLTSRRGSKENEHSVTFLVTSSQ
jgi:hypothetical protein